MDELLNLESPLAKLFSGLGTAVVAALAARIKASHESHRLVHESDVAHFLQRSDSEIGLIEDVDVERFAPKLRQRASNREKNVGLHWGVLVSVGLVLPLLLGTGCLLLVNVMIDIPVGYIVVGLVFVWTLVWLFNVVEGLVQREDRRRRAAWLYGVSLEIDRFAGTDKRNTELSAQPKEYKRLLDQVSDRSFVTEMRRLTEA